MPLHDLTVNSCKKGFATELFHWTTLSFRYLCVLFHAGSILIYGSMITIVKRGFVVITMIVPKVLWRYEGLWRNEGFVMTWGFVKVCLVCQNMKGLWRYERFIKVWRVCEGMKGLSKNEGYVKVCWVCLGMKCCQSMLGLSRHEKFVKLCRLCQGIKGYRGVQILNTDWTYWNETSLVSFWIKYLSK